MASQSRDLLGRELRAHHIALCINRKERFVFSGVVRCTSGGPVHRYGLARRAFLSRMVDAVFCHKARSTDPYGGSTESFKLCPNLCGLS